MPNGSQQFDDDEFDGDDGNLVAQLRKALKAKDKENESLRAQFGELATRDRQRTLNEAFSAAGLNAKVARFYPSDGDLTDDAIGAWIKDNAEIFGATAPATTSTTTDAGSAASAAAGSDESDAQPFQVDPSVQAAYMRMQAASLVGGAATTREQDLLREIAQAKSPDELQAALRARP